MAYLLGAGIQVSLDNSTWYKLTDHNREPIEINPELIENQSRMANGKMRKYVIAKKNTISTSWSFLPSNDSSTTTATLFSGGAQGTSQIVITQPGKSVAFPNYKVEVGQRITGTGFDTDTFVTAISKDYPGVITFSKPTVSQVSGTITFTISNLLVDGESGTKGASWLTAFYNANNNIPIYLKIIESKHTTPASGQVPSDSTFVSAKSGENVYQVFMTNFSKTILKRTQTTDFVDMNIEFTEI